MEHDTMEEAEIDRLEDEPPAASPKNGRKKKAEKPAAPVKLCPCGCSLDSQDRRFCWDCREIHKDIVVRLVAEAYAAGEDAVAGVAKVFDWADAVIVERGRRMLGRAAS